MALTDSIISESNIIERQTHVDIGVDSVRLQYRVRVRDILIDELNILWNKYNLMMGRTNF